MKKLLIGLVLCFSLFAQTITNSQIVNVSGGGGTPSGAAGGVLSGTYPNPGTNCASAVCVDSVTLQPADIEALNTTPFQVIAAPGAGKYIQPFIFSSDFMAGGTPYVDYAPSGATVRVFYENNATGLYVSGDLFHSDSTYASVSSPLIFQPDLYRINEPLILQFRTIATGRIQASTLNAGGANFAANDPFTVTGGNGLATGLVDTLSGSAVATYHIVTKGIDYTATTGNATTTSPTGESGLRTAVKNAGGAMYVTGDTSSVDGCSNTTLTVTAVAGVVTSVAITDKGDGCTAAVGATTTNITGVGVGLTVNTTVLGSGFTLNTTIQSVAGGTGTLKVTVPYIIITIP